MKDRAMEWGADFLKEADALQRGDLSTLDFSPEIGMQEPVAVIRVKRDADGALTVDNTLPVFSTRAEFEKMVEAEFGGSAEYREGYSLRGENGALDTFEIIGLGSDFIPGAATNTNAIAVFKIGAEGNIESYGAYASEAALLKSLQQSSSHQFLGHASFDLSNEMESASLKDLGFTVVELSSKGVK